MVQGRDERRHRPRARGRRGHDQVPRQEHPAQAAGLQPRRGDLALPAAHAAAADLPAREGDPSPTGVSRQEQLPARVRPCPWSIARRRPTTASRDRSPRAAASCSTAASATELPAGRARPRARTSGCGARTALVDAPADVLAVHRALRRRRLRRDLDEHVGAAERAAPRRPAGCGTTTRAGALDGRRAARPAARARRRSAEGGRAGDVRGRVQPQRRRRHARRAARRSGCSRGCSTTSRPT